MHCRHADMDSMWTSRSHNLYVIEDCAQAHSRYKGKLVGTIHPGLASRTQDLWRRRRVTITADDEMGKRAALP